MWRGLLSWLDVSSGLSCFLSSRWQCSWLWSSSCWPARPPGSQGGPYVSPLHLLPNPPHHPFSLPGSCHPADSPPSSWSA